jgi:hypothetical protein
VRTLTRPKSDVPVSVDGVGRTGRVFRSAKDVADAKLQKRLVLTREDEDAASRRTAATKALRLR